MVFLAGDRLANVPLRYSTSFAATENPISEGGRWRNGLADALDWSNMRVTSGIGAYGTMAGPVGPPYDDSHCSILAPPGYHWSDDQIIETQVFIDETARNAWTGFHELEHHMRVTLRPGFLRLYEALYPVTNQHKLELVLWMGPAAQNGGGAGGNPNTFAVLAEQLSWPGLNNGDWIKTVIKGPLIEMFCREDDDEYDEPFLSHDTTNDADRISSGGLGIGHWLNGNGSNADHAFRNLSVVA